jgi:hypothetical protein
VILWLWEGEFERKNVSRQLRELEKQGLEIRWSAGVGPGPYSKFAEAVRQFPNATIVTADDDQWYTRDWLKTLLAARRPGAVVCHRAWAPLARLDGTLMPYVDWMTGQPSRLRRGTGRLPPLCTGVGGVLYPPQALHPDWTNWSLALELAPKADDLWAWANELRAGTPIVFTRTQDGLRRDLPEVPGTGMWHANVERGQNDMQMNAIVKRLNMKRLLARLAKADRRRLNAL